jgi:outer membrane protein
MFIIVALSLLFVQGVCTFIWTAGKGKTAYINTEELYNSFGLKTKLESELKKTQAARQSLLDSLRLQLDMMSMRIRQERQENDSNITGAFANLRESYFARQEEFKQSSETLAQQYTGQIWTQLNQYISDYGHDKGYQYIFGANGDGALMFADDAVNITEELKGYVNERFKGQP